MTPDTARAARVVGPWTGDGMPQAQQHARGLGVSAGLIAALAFATSGPMVKPLLAAGWTPGAAICARLLLGTLLLAGPVAWTLRGRWTTLREEWRLVLAFGLLGVAAASTCYFLAVERLPVAVALLVEYTGPLLLIGWSWLRTRQSPSRLTLVGAALAMAGLALVLDLAGALVLDPVGLAFALAAAIGNAGYFALTARPTALPPVALAGAGMAVGALAVVLVTAAGVLPFAAPDVHVDLLGTSVHWSVPLAVVGVLPTAFGFGISAVSVRLLGERVASFLALSEVLFAVLLAWLLLHERPLPVQIVGAVLVVLGVATVRRGADTDVRTGAAAPPPAAVAPAPTPDDVTVGANA